MKFLAKIIGLGTCKHNFFSPSFCYLNYSTITHVSVRLWDSHHLKDICKFKNEHLFWNLLLIMLSDFFIYLLYFWHTKKTLSACAHGILDIIGNTLSAALKDTPVKKSFLWTFFDLLYPTMYEVVGVGGETTKQPRIVSTQASILPTMNRPIPARVKRYFNIQSFIRHLGKENNSKKKTQHKIPLNVLFPLCEK